MITFLFFIPVQQNKQGGFYTLSRIFYKNYNTAIFKNLKLPSHRDHILTAFGVFISDFEGEENYNKYSLMIFSKIFIIQMEFKHVSTFTVRYKIFKHFSLIYSSRMDILNVTAYVADLANSNSDEIKSILGHKLKKSLKFKIIEDPALIGGIKVRIGNKFLDSTIKSQLSEMKRSLIESKRN